MLYTSLSDTDVEFYLIGCFMQLLSMHKKEILSYTQRNTDGTFQYYKEASLYIQEYLLMGITPSDAAQYLHISPSYLRTVFSKHCKYSLRELLIRKRLECAVKRQIYDNNSIAETASFVGYPDYTLFSKIFKKYIGISPRQYKKLHENEGKEHFQVDFHLDIQKQKTPVCRICKQESFYMNLFYHDFNGTNKFLSG